MHKRGFVWGIMLCVIAAMFLKLPQMVARQDTVLQTYAPLVEVDALARQQFVEVIRDDRLVHGAIRGMLRQLDPYSGYVAPHELASFERHSAGRYIGIGVEMGIRDQQLTVIAPIEGSPAAEAGIKAGDAIVGVDGVNVKRMSMLDIERLLHGAPGSTVALTIRRDSLEGTLTLTVRRGQVKQRSVRGCRRLSPTEWDYMIDPIRRVAYIRVSSFQETTSAEFDAALDELTTHDIAGLILDLRFNPGGLMLEAVAMVDRFVTDGVIVSTATRREAIDHYHATAPGTHADIPLAVLINKASASSSEIVAGSLQDHGRAVIVGERSFGKGSVQQLMYLKQHPAAIKLTVAYYRLPHGRIIHRGHGDTESTAWGVEPDIRVVLSETETLAIQQSRAALDRVLSASIDSAPTNAHMPACADPGLLRPIAGMIALDCQLVAAHTALVAPTP